MSVRGLVALAVVWLLVAGFAALEFWPAWPSSWRGWIAFFIVMPPLYLLGEMLSELLWSEDASRTARVAAGLALVAVICGLIAAGSRMSIF